MIKAEPVKFGTLRASPSTIYCLNRIRLYWRYPNVDAVLKVLIENYDKQNNLFEAMRMERING